MPIITQNAKHVPEIVIEKFKKYPSVALAEDINPVPAYEIVGNKLNPVMQIFQDRLNGKLKENDNLPSVRSLAKELKISALTVKKAYDNLESEGFTVTVHGKGTYVAATNTELLLEEQKKELEADLEQAIQKGRRCGICDEDIKSLFELILEG